MGGLMSNAVVAGVQKLTYGAVYWPFRLIFGLSALVHPDLVGLGTGRFLVVANHQAVLDGHMILSALPYAVFRQLVPIRFFCANVYLRLWWQKLLLGATGCFPAYATYEKLSGVGGGVMFSDAGNSLFIFPEGKRRGSTETVHLKPGVGRLVKKRGFVILPVYIKRGRRTSVRWGKYFRVPKVVRSKTEESVTEYVFDKVLQLA